MPDAIALDKLSAVLWQDDDDAVYAILDGAGIANLLDKLYGEPQPEFACLYRGEIAPDIAEVAPYLVKLEAGSDFLRWVASGWGNAWGIFVVVPAELDISAVRRHLRKLNLVAGPDGETLMFRYYDPRVLRDFLPTCDAGQLREIFGPIRRILDENGESTIGAVFSLVAGNQLVTRLINFG